jgi:ABC-2 type transport system ATP-binding protein
LVERICDRVGIIDHGRLVAIGSVEDLRRGGPDRLWVDAPAAGENLLRKVSGATVVGTDGSRLLVELAPGANDQAVLLAALRTGPVHEFRPAEQSLGELFRGYIEEGRQ